MQTAGHALEIVAKQLHAEMSELDSVTAGKSARRIGRDVASRIAAARFAATLYFAVLTLLFRLHQSIFTGSVVRLGKRLRDHRRSRKRWIVM